MQGATYNIYQHPLSYIHDSNSGKLLRGSETSKRNDVNKFKGKEKWRNRGDKDNYTTLLAYR